jgi:UDP-N-acetylglucosamine 2-epimerase (non-hydrolysing)
MAPVIKELAKHSDRVKSVVCVTAQHRYMLDQVLDLFQIIPDYDLNLMQDDQSLAQLTGRLLKAIEPVLLQVKPDWALVQGDTTTMMAVSLAAFYHEIKIGHVEAGLRTYNKRAPFPEEINRCITSLVADLHFAPTEQARRALLAENIPDSRIRVTGNTVIDALLWVRDLVRHSPPSLPEGLEKAIEGHRLILVTAHRRESFLGGLEQICTALIEIVEKYSDVCIVYPVHLNPNVRTQVNRLLNNCPRVHLIDPLDYAPFVWLMDRAFLILTDSGGIQEEAPSLGKPVVVMRDITERPEGVVAGNACLVGTKRRQIVTLTDELLKDRERYRQMSEARNPYGDGRAAKLIVRFLLEI